MLYDSPLKKGYLKRRYKRFLAEITLEETDVTAHCPNTGSMQGLLTPGSEVWLSPSHATLPWKWELASQHKALVSVNTLRTNHIVAEALEAHLIDELASYTTFRREVKVGDSRIDFLLDGRCLLEVKSVTLSRTQELAEFPDARTSRGTKHLRCLSAWAQDSEAALLYLVQREDCHHFSVASDIDPLYHKAVQEAYDAGVRILCYDCSVTPQSITLNRRIDIRPS